MTGAAVKRNDVGVMFTAALRRGSVPVDLTDATVVFVMALPDATPTIEADADVVNAVGGTVQYVSLPGDLAIAGKYRVEWEVSFLGGHVETFPSGSWDTVIVVEDLNSE